MEFNIKFISPLLIHGANTRELDSVELTGKALRGCWRFWFRAILGGIVDNISPQLLYEHESHVFGSADENIGAKFRLLVETISIGKPSPTQIAFSSRRVSFWGYPEGSEFRITVRPRKNMGNKEVDVLLATIWMWANLGAIGQRARRGFGSPIMVAKDPHFEALRLPETGLFTKQQYLEDYLKAGLSSVGDIISDRLNLQAASIANNLPPAHQDNYFRLRSLEQIAVSEHGQGSNIQEVLNKVHGKSSNNGELGGAWGNRRLASPVFLRLHKVNQDFYPVVTWSKLDDRGIARDWIKKQVGCNKYLSGKSL